MADQDFTTVLAIYDFALWFSFIVGIFYNCEWTLNILRILDGASQIDNMALVKNAIAFPYGNGDEPAGTDLVECAPIGESE